MAQPTGLPEVVDQLEQINQVLQLILQVLQTSLAHQNAICTNMQLLSRNVEEVNRPLHYHSPG